SGEESIYTVGYFEGTADLDPDAIQVLNMTSMGGYDMFISKLNASGDLIWADQIGSIGFDQAMAIAVDTSGTHSVYLTGAFQGTVDFDPGPQVVALTSIGDFDAFVLKLTGSGDLDWVKSFGGTSYEYGMGLSLDPSGNGMVHTVGYFSGSVDLDPDPFGTLNFTSAGNIDLYISQLDGSGNFVSGMVGGGFAPDMALTVTTDPNGDLFLAGSFFSPTITLGNTTLTNAIDFASTGDIFIAKLVRRDTGLHPDLETGHFILYPNPARGEMIIRSDLDLRNTTIQLVDALGREVLHTNFDSVMNVSHLAPGIYVLRIIDEAGLILSRRIIHD
ncbi:MAG: T9SS type A sorting domain-containing protein, partial [Bacteroidota bacterium]|nr:T9SS type A sorting domain-containing protein [Bacteroidota bacterium]